VGGGTGILIGTGDLGMVRNAGRPLPQVSERTREKCWRALGDDFGTFLGEFVSSYPYPVPPSTSLSEIKTKR